MSTDPATSYDEIPYSDHCFPYTHPDYLATMGLLYGVETAPVARCRVLELGCARGGNIIPMAQELPDATFVGIDLSTRQIESAQAVAGKLGLRNLDLRALSITDVDDRLGTFDFIICHGVYSWVPAFVRDKILAICAANLAENGVAYVSYNTYPGWHARGMIRELMAFHVRRSTAALDRVEQARGFLDGLIRVLPDQSSAYARILRTEGEFLRGVGNSYLYHEHLEETNHPFYFHEFIGQATAKRLRYLAEARTPGLMENLAEASREVIERWSDDEIAREQYLDFLCNRTFRRTLLVHARRERRAEPSAEALSALALSSIVVPVSAAPDFASDVAEEFRRPEGEATLTTNNPVVKAALTVLSGARPQALPFAVLRERVRALLGREEGDDDARTLRGAMLRGFLSNLVELHIQPPRFATTPGARPVASPLARLQSEESAQVTNLRRRTVELGELDRLVLRRLDGAHDRAAILDELKALVASDDFTIYEGEQPIRDPSRTGAILSECLEVSLARLAGLSLLVE